VTAVGVIGLGQMGLPMAANLVRRGFATTGFDIAPAATAAARSVGVRIAESPAAVLDGSQVVLLSLPDEKALEALLLGADGLVHRQVGDKIIVDTTTTTVAMAERLARVFAASDGFYLDAPVTGGVGGAEKGALSMMVGGEASALERARPMLEALATTIVHVGPSGHGQVAKMVNQMLMGAIYTSVAEAFAFAAQFGADVAKVYEAVEHGGAQSRLLSAIKPGLLAGTVTTRGNLHQHGKDLDYVMREAIQRQMYLPLLGSVHGFFQLSRSLGFGEVRCHEMWAVWGRLLGLKITDTIDSSFKR
jgi:3-hydroxyisobutyrate dehydrogenase-like beta-hydroxyacid dehydrogenase